MRKEDDRYYKKESAHSKDDRSSGLNTVESIRSRDSSTVGRGQSRDNRVRQSSRNRSRRDALHSHTSSGHSRRKSKSSKGTVPFQIFYQLLIELQKLITSKAKKFNILSGFKMHVLRVIFIHTAYTYIFSNRCKACRFGVCSFISSEQRDYWLAERQRLQACTKIITCGNFRAQREGST